MVIPTELPASTCLEFEISGLSLQVPFAYEGRGGRSVVTIIVYGGGRSVVTIIAYGGGEGGQLSLLLIACQSLAFLSSCASHSPNNSNHIRNSPEICGNM